ncbi:MAG: TonB-dependent receptor [Alphaproteobacteria bacterium]|nr:MAG: TonB-dependent receptor [Alphaproteobacteria bacterium]
MLIAAMGLMAAPAAAQDAQTQCAADQVIGEDGKCVDEASVEEVIVTGSRIRRSEFTSAKPIQILSGETSRELGLFDTAQILQSSNQSTGLQIDNTFGGFVLDNGPGASTIGLRGLDPERTLVLLNGRRIAPAGVGGAPVAPDLNLIPSIMVDRIDLLLDGASTIYGSDAIAGVANVILKKDVEGFDAELSYNVPVSGGGEELSAGLMWGIKSDKGSFVIGAEFYDRKAQSMGENPFMGDCEGFYYEDRKGNILTGNRTVGPEESDYMNCDIYPLTNRMSIPVFWGSVYYTPGFSNTGYPGFTDGIPNFSESGVALDYTDYYGSEYQLVPHWVAVDSDGDGVIDAGIPDLDGNGLKDFDFQNPLYNWQRSAYANSGDFYSALRRVSVVANGEYNLQDDNDTTFFFEGLYATRKSDIFNPGAQIFEIVPEDNPYNPCNPDSELGTGVDCLGVIGFPIGATYVQPIINIRGDRDYYDVSVYQYRLMGGVRGNIGSWDKLGAGGWNYEVYASYSYSHGTDSRQGISEPRLLQSLDAEVDGNGNVVCRDTSDGCVAVNLFGSNIMAEGGGTLTDAEANFLFVDRRMETTVEQTMVSGSLQGDLFRLPWNDATVPIVFGYEFRRDSIASNPNDVTAEGLLWGYYSDLGADGSRDLHEFFTETEIPLLRGVKMAEELTISASARWTDESYYSPASTYNVNGVYRPVSYLTFRGSYGTSYRAPNLRERFLNGTTGFQTLSDPCVVPDSARDGDPTDPTAPDTYNASQDTRLQRVLDACRASGVDPTALGLDPDYINRYSVEVSTGGSETLTEERSTAYTYGIVFEQPFSDKFDLRFAATYYSVDIKDGVSSPSAAFMVARCYDNVEFPNATSAFCDRIDRGSDGRISALDASFINIGQETSKGWDFNIYYQQDFEVASKTLGVSLDLRAMNLREQVYSILDDTTDYAGWTFAPHWRATATLQLRYDDFGFNWNTRWIEGGKDGAAGSYLANGAPCKGTGVDCRPVNYTTNYNVHNASLTWNNGDFRVAVGVRNVFNQSPPKVDGAGVLSVRNVPIGVGYDLFGRSVFMTVGKTF